MSREGMSLTEWAQAERDQWEEKVPECQCFLCPPCASCTHPGNPRNQEEDDSCWEPGVEETSTENETSIEGDQP